MPLFRRKPSARPVRSRSGIAMSEAQSAALVRAAEAGRKPGPVVDPGRDVLDVCSSMFDVCRHCQESHLDRLGAACMFDVDGGEVPAWMFGVLRTIVEMMVADIAGGVRGRIPGAAVGVTLRRSGEFWALAIAENISGDAGARRAARRLTMVRALTDRLDCVCRILPNAWGSTIAIAFPLNTAGHAEVVPIPANRILH